MWLTRAQREQIAEFTGIRQGADNCDGAYPFLIVVAIAAGVLCWAFDKWIL